MSVEFMQVYGWLIIAIQNFVFVYLGDQVAERRVKNFFVTYIAMNVVVVGFRYVEVTLQNINLLFGIAMIPLIGVAVFGSIYKAPLKKLFILSVSFSVFSVLSEIITIIILQFFLDFRSKDYTNPIVQYTDQGIGSVISMLIVEIQGLFCLFLYKKREKKIDQKEIILMVVMMMYELIATILYYESCKMYDVLSAVLGIIMSVFSTGMNIYTLYAMEKMRERRETQKHYNELMEQRAKELLYYEKQYQRIEDSRILRHEFANYLQTVQELVGKKENKNAALEMLAAMEEMCQ